MENAIDELIKLSVLGPVLVAAGWYILRQSKTLQQIQEDRAKDASAVIDRILQLNDKWNTTLSAQIAAFESQKDALREVKEALRDVRDALEYRRTNGV